MDYPFQRALVDVVAGAAGTDELAKLFRADALYEGGSEAALQLVTFTGNYDVGRFGYFIRHAMPAASPEEVLRRDLLAHAMVLTLRGVPAIYAGDEQGFAGMGGDQDARQDMFASKVATYNSESLIGSTATTASDNFNSEHPMYREIAKLAHIRTSHPALTRGLQRIRFASDKPGLFAVSRFNPNDGREILLLFNTSTSAIHQNVRVETGSTTFETLAGDCPAEAAAPGTVTVNVPPLGYAVCYAR